MTKEQKDSVPPITGQTLIEVVFLASDASFAIKAVSVSFRFPEVEGQRQVLARLADHAAEKADLVHRALRAALEGQEGSFWMQRKKPDES